MLIEQEPSGPAPEITVNGGASELRLSAPGRQLALASAADVTSEAMRTLAAEHGIDYATRFLYERIVQSPEHQSTITRLNQLRDATPAGLSLAGFTCAIAPGAFFREFPHTGADGRILREAAEK